MVTSSEARRAAALSLSAFTFAVGPTGCASDDAPEAGCVASNAVYGVDGRVEIGSAGEPWRSLSTRSVALVPSSLFDDVVDSSSLSARSAATTERLCSDEAFANEPSLAHCSGFLLAEDLVLTAGHCAPENRCDDDAFVTGFEIPRDGSAVSIGSLQSRTCARVEASDPEDPDGYSLVRLASPFPVSGQIAVRDTPVAVGEPVFLLGYPSGLPLKLHGGGAVIWNAPDRARFGTDLDAFSGDSGGPVFDADGALVGVMNRGQSDYVYDPVAECMRPSAVTAVSDSGLFELVTAIGPILDSACRHHVQTACDLRRGPERRVAGEPCGE